MQKHLGATKASAHPHSVFSMCTFDQVPLATPTSADSETRTKSQRVLKGSWTVNTKAKEHHPKYWASCKYWTQISEAKTKLNCQAWKSNSWQPNMRNMHPKNSLAVNTRRPRAATKRPGTFRAWFYFKCGKTIVLQWAANPTLVQVKNAELKKKQADFFARQATIVFYLN